MRQGLFWRLPFIPVGILLWMIFLIPSLGMMTGFFRAVASGAPWADNGWGTADVNPPLMICVSVATLVAWLLIAVGLVRMLLGWLGFGKVK